MAIAPQRRMGSNMVNPLIANNQIQGSPTPIGAQSMMSGIGQLPANQPQLAQTQQPQPQFGLAGQQQALLAGQGAGISALEQGQRGALNTLGLGQNAAQQNLAQGRAALGGNFNVNQNTGQPLFQQAAAGVGAFSPAGLQAQGVQSALSGAQGQDAFNQAFIDSPVQQFLRDQGEQSRINQAAATGGVGGGAIQKELTRFGQGLAGTQLQQQIQNLDALSGQGLQAAAQQGGFLSQAGQQQGNLANQNAARGLQAAQGQANLFGQGAGISSALAGQGANIQSGLGQQAANIFTGTGQQLGQARGQAGRDIAGQVGNVTSQLSQLTNQQGGGLSDIIGQGGSNLANLLSGSGQLNANQQTQLAQILANISTGQGSQIAQAQQGIGQVQAGGISGAAQSQAGTLQDAASLAAFLSDERLKKNIKKIDSKNGVNIYSWDWNGLLGLVGEATGVLAQEVERLIPNSVIETNTGYKAVRYDIVGEYINASK